MMKSKEATLALALSLASLLPQAVGAQTPDTKNAPAAAPASADAQTADAERQARRAKLIKEGQMIIGPAKIPFGDVAAIDLPAGFAFIKDKTAAQVLEKSGGVPQGLFGLIYPLLPPTAKDGEDFMLICSFDDMGYVNDDDAGKLDAGGLLQSYKEGQAEENDRRKEEGLAPFYVGGWAEEPRYVKDKHQVVWALTIKDEDTANAPVVTINYNTRVLGRKGVLMLNLVTAPDYLNQNKVQTAKLLDRTAFVAGNKYEEYQPGKDKSSGLGLAGLILGGGALAAAAKLGVLGGAWKWILGMILVGKKFIILIVVAIGAAISKFFKRGPKDGESSS